MKCGETKYIERKTRMPVFQPKETAKEMFVDKNGRFVKVHHTSKLSGRPFNLNDANQQCSICMIEFRKEDQIEETSCEHKFHAKCLQKRLQVKPVCPECRMPIDRSTNDNTSIQNEINSC